MHSTSLEHVKGISENFWGSCGTSLYSGMTLKESYMLLLQDFPLHPLWLCPLGLGAEDNRQEGGRGGGRGLELKKLIHV